MPSVGCLKPKKNISYSIDSRATAEAKPQETIELLSEGATGSPKLMVSTDESSRLLWGKYFPPKRFPGICPSEYLMADIRNGPAGVMRALNQPSPTAP